MSLRRTVSPSQPKRNNKNLPTGGQVCLQYLGTANRIFIREHLVVEQRHSGPNEENSPDKDSYIERKHEFPRTLILLCQEYCCCDFKNCFLLLEK